MPTTLTYGRKVPIDGETGGNDWFDNLEDNIALDDAHSHNGVNSTLLTTSSTIASSHAVNNTVTADLTTGWVLQSDGSYKRTISISSFFSSLEFDEVDISWRVFTGTASGENLYDIFYPTIEKIGESTYNVTTNLDVTTLTTPYFLVVYTS